MSIIVEISRARNVLDYREVSELIGYHGSISPIAFPDMYKEYVCFSDINEPDNILHCVTHKTWESAKGYGFTLEKVDTKIIQRPLTVELPKGRNKVYWSFKIEDIIDKTNDKVNIVAGVFLVGFPTKNGVLTGKYALNLEVFKNIIIKGEVNLSDPWIVGIIKFFPEYLIQV